MLDAFALVALARDEPAADEVEVLLRRGDRVVTAVNLVEVLDPLGRVLRQPPEPLQAELSPLLDGALPVVSVDGRIAWRAAELRRRHYVSRTSELSLADCVALAAVGPADSLATADPPLARAARVEALEVVALPDSRGRRPTIRPGPERTRAAIVRWRLPRAERRRPLASLPGNHKRGRRGGKSSGAPDPLRADSWLRPSALSKFRNRDRQAQTTRRGRAGGRHSGRGSALVDR